MPKSKAAAGIPKLAGFERIKYHGLTLTGLTSRVYSAYFGQPKRIIDAYNVLYCRGKEKPLSTGRISIATSQLVDANYLDLYQIESSNWPLLAANLLPLHELFEIRKVRLNDSDQKRLQASLVPNYEAAARFGITEEEASGKAEFVPSPFKIKAYLNSVATLALITLFKQQQPEFKEERELLRRIKAKTYGLADQKDEAAADFAKIENFSSDLVLNTRVSLKEGEEPANILLFKIARLIHEPAEVKKIEEEVIELFE
ncbi:MAG: hypothetical protein V1835_05495 [Candidatus Micrarchaeota archaeon]